MKIASVEVPLNAESVANLREHWAKKAERNTTQRRAVAYRMTKVPGLLSPVVRVVITRRSPRALDGDNLQSAMKAVRDQVASTMRVDDRTPLVAWEYRQEKGEPAILIDLEWMR